MNPTNECPLLTGTQIKCLEAYFRDELKREDVKLGSYYYEAEADDAPEGYTVVCCDLFDTSLETFLASAVLHYDLDNKTVTPMRVEVTRD